MQPITCKPTALLSIPIPPHFTRAQMCTQNQHLMQTQLLIYFKFICLTKSLPTQVHLVQQHHFNEAITIDNVPITLSVVSSKRLHMDRGSSVMVWEGISVTGRKSLVRINGNLNAQRYITEILTPHVRPFAQKMGQNFFLQQDSARAHTA